jgi:hypothetical protein
MLTNDALDESFSAWQLGMMVILCAECNRQTRMTADVAEAKAVASRLRSVVLGAIMRVNVMKQVLQAEGGGDAKLWVLELASAERRVRQEIRSE